MIAPDLDVAIGQHDQQVRRRDLRRDMLQQQQRRLVRPVEVVERHDRRLPRRGIRQERGHGLEQPELRVGALGLRSRWRWRQPQVANQLGQPLKHAHELRHVLLDDLAVLRPVDDRGERAHGRQPWPVRERSPVLTCVPPVGTNARSLGNGRELTHEPRLADAGLADHRDDGPLAGDRAVQSLLERSQLRLAPDEDAAPRAGRAVAPHGRLVDTHGLGEALELVLTAVDQLDPWPIQAAPEPSPNRAPVRPWPWPRSARRG